MQSKNSERHRRSALVILKMKTLAAQSRRQWHPTRVTIFRSIFSGRHFRRRTTRARSVLVLTLTSSRRGSRFQPQCGAGIKPGVSTPGNSDVKRPQAPNGGVGELKTKNGIALSMQYDCRSPGSKPIGTDPPVARFAIHGDRWNVWGKNLLRP